MCVLFAATYPERVRALVLYGTYAKRSHPDDDYPWAPTQEERERLRARARGGLGRGRRPVDDDAERRRRCGRLVGRRGRAALSPAGARDLILMNSKADVRDAPRERAVPDAGPPPHRRPRLQGRRGPLHRRAASRARASSSSPGDDHVPFVDPDQILDEVEEFLTGVRPATARHGPRARDHPLHGSRRLDREGARARRRGLGGACSTTHHAAVRRELGGSRARRSTPPATASSRSSTARRARFAAGSRSATRCGGSGSTVRAGVHTGEVERPAR